MSVLIEALSVVVTNKTLEEKYLGGLLGYRGECPNQTFCTDGHLSRVGFMVPEDVGAFVEKLKCHGLDFAETGDFTDIAVVDQMTGPTAPCPWLYFAQHPDGYSLAWLPETDPHNVYVPDGWVVGQSRMTFYANEDVADRLLEVADEDGLTTVIDLDTGKETFIVRMHRRPDGLGGAPQSAGAGDER
jgi:hypothetical protein